MTYSPIKINIPDNSTIKKIYHISDIHINLYKKHDEYTQVFNNLYTFIEDEMVNHSYTNYDAILVVTGDILHSKTELSPECIQLTNDFFSKLSQLIPVCIIAGNHDANLSNLNRLDSLSPIIGKLDIDPNTPFYYFKDTGIYEVGNISFGVTSVFDYKLLKANQITRTDSIKIALFHGRVNGALTDTGVNLEGEDIDDDFELVDDFDPMNVSDDILEPEIEDNDKINPKSFDGYDYVLMGDIHKHQYLNKEKTIAYAGSLIQQNHGETLNNHGVLVWDLETGDSKLHDISNTYGYYTLKIKDEHNLCLINCLPNLDINNQLSDLENRKKKLSLRKINTDDDEYKHKPQCCIPQNVRLRIEYTNLTYAQQERIVSLIKLNHNVIETQFKPLGTDEDDEDNEVNKLSFNVKDVNCQNDFLDKYFNTKTKDKDKLTPTELEQIKVLNEELNKDLSTNTIEHMNWKLCRLEFDNLFSYDSNNSIDFTKCEGVVGIIAPNHTGKSAIIDIIMYCLFNKFSRKGDIKDMVNIKSNSFRAYLVFRIGNYLYHIEKKGTYSQSKSRRASELPVKVDFYRTNLNKTDMKNLKGEKPKDTMNKILDYVGSYEDMILTSVSLQGNNTNFIDITDTPRKNEMEKLLKIDIFTDLKEKASKIINEKKTVFKYLKQMDIMDEITQKVKETQDKKSTYKKLKVLLDDLDVKFNNHQTKVDKLRKSVLKLESQSNTDLWNEIINKFKLGQIGFQIPENDLNIINDNEPEIYNIYQELTSQWENINDINKLDWITLQQELKEIRDNLMNLTQLMETQKKNINIKIDNTKTTDDTETSEITISSLKNDIKITQNKLAKLHSSLTPLDDVDIEYCQNEMTKILKEKENLATKIEESPDTEIDISKQIKKANKSLKEYNQLITETEDNRDTLMKQLQETQTTTIETDKDNIKKIVTKIKSIIDSNIDNQLSTDLCNKITNKLEHIEECINNFGIDTTLTEEIDELNTTIKKCHKKIKKYQIQKTDAETENTKLCQIKQKNKYELEQLNWKYEELNKNIETIKKNEELNIKITSKQKKLKKLNAKLDSLNIHEIYTTQGISAITLVNSVNRFLNKIKNQEGDYVRYRSLNKDLETEEKILEKMSMDRDKTKEAYYQLKSDVKQYAHEIQELNKKKEEIQQLELDIKLYQNYLVAVKNIPYMLIQSVKPKLEQMINEMLSTLVDFTIYFDIKDNKHISIYIKRESEKHRREVLLSNASGFEKFIGGLFIRIALINISNLPKPNFLFIDEGWSCFDGNNINNVGLIFDYLKNKFDFILTISHLQELRQHLNQHIILKKEKGWSHVSY